MEGKVPFDVLAQGDKEIIRELEKEYHKIAEKAPEEVIYQSAQGRQVQLTEDADLLDDAQQVVRRARSGEVFLVKTEVMKENTVLWLEVPQDPTKPEGPQAWVKKSSTRTIPREDEEVWGF
jgi:hypothetical protein